MEDVVAVAGIGHEGDGGHDAASKVLEGEQIVVVAQETDTGRGGSAATHERNGEGEEGSAWAGHMQGKGTPDGQRRARNEEGGEFVHGVVVGLAGGCLEGEQNGKD